MNEHTINRICELTCKFETEKWIPTACPNACAAFGMWQKGEQWSMATLWGVYYWPQISRVTISHILGKPRSVRTVGCVVETPISTWSDPSSQSFLLPQSRDSFPRYVILGILGMAPRLSADPRSSLSTRQPRHRSTCELSHVTGFFGQGLASTQSAVPSIPMTFHTFPCHVF